MSFTSSGLEPATLRFPAECLNQLRYTVRRNYFVRFVIVVQPFNDLGRSRSYFTTCDQILLPVGMLLSEICGLVSVKRPL
jgi:hypothetical protein